MRSDRRKFFPWPLAGGKPGTPSWNVINPANGEPPAPSKITCTIKGGDVYRHVTGGGGGYGSPFERPLDLTAADVIDGKITREYAEREYGVVFKPGSNEIDEAATRKKRASLTRSP